MHIHTHKYIHVHAYIHTYIHVHALGPSLILFSHKVLIRSISLATFSFIFSFHKFSGKFLTSKKYVIIHCGTHAHCTNNVSFLLFQSLIKASSMTVIILYCTYPPSLVLLFPFHQLFSQSCILLFLSRLFINGLFKIVFFSLRNS